MPAASFERPPTAQEAVLAELRRALLEGELAPGQRIDVQALSKQLGVSRAPVRDALRVLEGEEQVCHVPHRGYTVTALDLDELFDVYRMRELIEAEVIALAVPRLTDRDLDRIEQAAQDVSEALGRHDRIAGTARNRDFHFALFEACGHARLVRLVRQLWNADTARSLYMLDDVRARKSDEEHYAILRAARERDVAGVIEQMVVHRDGALETILGILRERGVYEGALPPDHSAWRPVTRSHTSGA